MKTFETKKVFWFYFENIFKKAQRYIFFINPDTRRNKLETLCRNISSGLKKPRKEQREKIINGLHKSGQELLSVSS